MTIQHLKKPAGAAYHRCSGVVCDADSEIRKGANAILEDWKRNCAMVCVGIALVVTILGAGLVSKAQAIINSKTCTIWLGNLSDPACCTESCSLTVQDLNTLVVWGMHLSRTSATPKILDLTGQWISNDYECYDSNGNLIYITEKIDIEQTGTSFVATKITGDNCVPAGHVTFYGTLPSCDDVINNGVTHYLSQDKTEIHAAFTPNPQFVSIINEAAQVCGFINFDWRQTITSLPAPSPFYAAKSTTALTAPPPFNDPPPNGYAYQNPPNAVMLPVYYNLFTSASNPLSLAANETQTTLSFYDAPADPCLHGGSGEPCGGKTAPAGAILGFTTHLVGIAGNLPGASVKDTGIGFSWTSSFNGTAGGIAVTNGYLPVDPGSGTGGITVTKVNNIMIHPIDSYLLELLLN
ncbi:MAG TPA: hypothetical protein VEF34_12480 [Syntrophobacteraceae bacterium]|nr:hypothetical protein [Syntrophobacteraceae bacterium]